MGISWGAFSPSSAGVAGSVCLHRMVKTPPSYAVVTSRVGVPAWLYHSRKLPSDVPFASSIAA